MKNPDYVRYEQAVKLKRLGFNWKCRYFYECDNKVLMPLEEIVSSIEGYDFCITSDTLVEDFNKQQDICSAPTIAQVQKWLREEKEIEVGVFGDFDGELPTGKWVWLMRKFNEHLFDTVFTEDDIRFNTYEEALIDGIDKTLELLKQQSNGKDKRNI